MVSDDLFPWKRFWYPRSGQVSLADDGFLIDPDSESAHYFQSDAIAFEALDTKPCLVFLGEQGIGKSNALWAEYELIKEWSAGNGDLALWFDLGDYSSDDRLERKIFECPEIKQWSDGTGTLHLFLDGFDEALLRVDTVSSILLTNLRPLPKNRLRLRIASRPQGWSSGLEEGLTKLWGEDNIGVYQLAPLRKRDVSVAAKSSGLDAGIFIAAIVESGAVPFANTPVYLKFLVREFKDTGTLPGSLGELYKLGCRSLCEETQKRKESPAIRGQLEVDQRLAVVGRIATVTQLTNKAAVHLGMASDLEPQDVPVNAIVGGTEGRATSLVTVDASAIREVLDTGLFTSRGLSRQGWRHKSYAEYLAAFHIYSHQFPLQTIRSILFHADGSGKVNPQLRSLAAWLSDMDAHVFNAIVESDPEVLLGETKIAGNTAEKAKIIRRLLNVFESGKMSKSVWDYRQRFSQLKTPELAQILTPYLSGPSRNDEAVIAAIEISRACELSEVGTLLAAIALDPTFHIRVRTHAAATIEDIGDLGARRLLRPLALSGQMEDLQDDLKGYGLLSCWPDHMTADELFCSLTQPKNENYISSYGRFLGGFSKSLRPDDMLSALRWVEREQEKNNQTALGRLSDTILERAVQFFDQADVRSAFASILMKSAAINPSLELRRSVTSCTLETRQALTRQLLLSREVGGAGWLKIVTICSLASTDVPWLLTELQHAPAGLAKHVCANIIGRLLDGHDVESYSAALLLANEDPDLATAIRHLVSPVDWNGPDAEQARHFYLLSKEDRESPEVEPAVSSSDHIESTLASNSPEAFFRIDSWLHRNKKRDPQHPIPGWEELDHDLRSKVIASAREYLETRPPVPAGNWWRQGIYTNGLVAGYNALHLLACESPYLLDQIDETGWAFWIKVALSYAPGSMDDGRAIILDRGYRLAQAEFLSTMSDSLDGESERHKRILLLNQMGDLWDEKIASILRAKLESDSFAVGAFVDVLNKLLKMKDTHARILARKIATRSVPESQEGRLKAVLTTGALLSEYPEEWTILWPILQSNVSFGIEVLQHAAPFPPSLGFTANLRENEIGDLCLWLSRLGLDRTDESGSELREIHVPSKPGWLWNSMINFLSAKGTSAACQAIRRLALELPQYPGLRSHSLVEAEERLRHATWSPFAPEAVVALSFRGAEGRLVISVHGIQTRGKWQKDINAELEKNGFRHEPLDYGCFDVIQLIIPWCRSRKIEWFRKRYERLLAAEKTTPSIIAHSFGTYIVASAIAKYDELRFDRVIFCGSIVSRIFDWRSVLKNGQVSAVLNEIGVKDIWPRIAKIFVGGAGDSGSLGFEDPNLLINQRRRLHFRHSDVFNLLNYKENWIPFLKGFEPVVAAERAIGNPASRS